LLPITPEGVFGHQGGADGNSRTPISPIQLRAKLLYAGSSSSVSSSCCRAAIWKPVQLQYLTAVGGYDAARYVHFFCMGRLCASWWAMSRSPFWCEEPARHDHRPA